MKLNRELNNFVVKMAVLNPDLVESSFLISYLNCFTKIYRGELKLSSVEQNDLFKLLETKMS